MDFTEQQMVIAGIKRRLLKLSLKKLSSNDFDFPESKQKLVEIHEFSSY